MAEPGTNPLFFHFCQMLPQIAFVYFYPRLVKGIDIGIFPFIGNGPAEQEHELAQIKGVQFRKDEIGTGPAISNEGFFISPARRFQDPAQGQAAEGSQFGKGIVRMGNYEIIRPFFDGDELDDFVPSLFSRLPSDSARSWIYHSDNDFRLSA